MVVILLKKTASDPKAPLYTHFRCLPFDWQSGSGLSIDIFSNKDLGDSMFLEEILAYKKNELKLKKEDF